MRKKNLFLFLRNSVWFFFIDSQILIPMNLKIFQIFCEINIEVKQENLNFLNNLHNEDENPSGV